tara:strand:+ start:99 stop:1355 length:1257 start_codon:yes stop_codon:yes gene_type:complete
MNINKKIKIIGFCKKYIEKNKKDTLIDPNIYFCSFADTLGYFFLKYKCYEDISNLIRKWLYKILNIIYALKTNEFEIYNLKKNTTKKIFFTYGKLNDFNKRGEFEDRYFGKIKQKKSLVVVIYLDQKLPINIKNNIVIIKQKKTNIAVSVFNLLKFNNLKNINLKYFSHETLSSFFLTKKLETILEQSKGVRIANILYESQNFNLSFINILKKKNIKVIGFIHSILPALPTNLIFKEPSPDKIFVSGDDTVRIAKTLGWNKKKIIQIKSIRFSKSKHITKNMCNKLFLPIQITNYNFYEKTIKKFFLLNQEFRTNLQIKEHPSTNKNSHYISFLSKVNNYLSSFKLKQGKQLKISFFIGSTSSVIEALERGLRVVHFVDDTVFQLYEKPLFKNIITTKLMDGVYSYRLLKKNSYIKLN